MAARSRHRPRLLELQTSRLLSSASDQRAISTHLSHSCPLGVLRAAPQQVIRSGTAVATSIHFAWSTILMTVFEALRRDHDHQRRLADALIQTEGACDERTRLFHVLKKALEVHALAEERHFYGPLMQFDLTQEMSRHSVAEHKEIDDLIEELSEMEMSSPGWLVRARVLHERLLHHLEEEEREVFQLAGKSLSDAQKSELADAYRDQMIALGAPEHAG